MYRMHSDLARAGIEMGHNLHIEMNGVLNGESHSKFVVHIASARWIFTAYSWAHSGLGISAGLIITQLGLFFVLQLRQLLIAMTLDCTATVTLTLIFTCTHTLTHTHSFSST